MNRILGTYIFLFAFVFSFQAQQVPLYNHYMINPFVINPAEAGFSSNTNIYMVRNQRFGGFGGATINNYLTADGTIMKEKAGIGFQLAQQLHGIQQQISSSLSYSYGIQLFTNHRLRLGISAGLLDNRIDNAAINVLHTDDPYLMTMRSNVSSFDMSAGLLYKYKNLKVGVSIPQVLANKVSYDTIKARGYYRLSRHFMSMLQYDFKIGQNIIVSPNALVRIAPGAPIQYDVTTQVAYGKKIWASATYKSDYAMQFNLGLKLFNQFTLGYSYELVTGSIKNYTSGIHHEILIGYTFKQGPRKPDVNASGIIHDTIIETIILEDIEQTNRIKDLEAKLRKALAEKDSLLEGYMNNDIDTTTPIKVEVIDETPTNQSIEEEDDIKDNDLIRNSEFYNFIELDGSNSPDGFYVISGVYSSSQNAQKELDRIKTQDSNTFMVISTSNNYYYIVTVLTQDRKEALDKCRSYRKLVNKNTWIIDYRKN